MSKTNAEERFLRIAKEVRRADSEYLKLVSTAQTVVPDAVHSMRAMHRMMGLMNEALKHSAKIERLAYKAFRQLAKCHDKKKRRLVQKHLSMEIIRTLADVDEDLHDVRVPRQVEWMKDNKIPLKTPRRRAPAKKK